MTNYYVYYQIWTPDVTCEADVERLKIEKTSLLTVKGIFVSKETAINGVNSFLSLKKVNYKRFDFEDKSCFSELKENGERNDITHIVQKVKGDASDLKNYTVGLRFRTCHVKEGALVGGVFSTMLFYKQAKDFVAEDFEDDYYFDGGLLRSTVYIL